LYNVSTDPGQQNNIYDQHPEVVRAMREHYEQWVAGTKPVMEQTNFVSVGTPREPTTWLSSCNWTGSYADNWNNLKNQHTPGFWSLQVESGGQYRVTMYLFHPAAKTPLNGKLKQITARPVAQARLLIDGAATTIQTAQTDSHVTFDIFLKKGQRVELEGQFLDRDGKVLCGAFYTFLQKKNQEGEVPSVIQYVSVGK
jgi:hypothetical protein